MLNAYQASGLSGREFSQAHDIKYQTFATWRQTRRELRENKGALRPATLQSITLVEATPEERPAHSLPIELPGGARIEASSVHQNRLAAQLLAELAIIEAGGDRC